MSWDSAVERFFINWRVRALLPYLKGRVLDVGCGANALIRAWGDGVGIDIYPWEGVDIVMDITKAGFKPKSFDTVLFAASLNHMSFDDRFTALNQAGRLLKRQGLLIVSAIGPIAGRIGHLLVRPWDSDQKVRKMSEDEEYGIPRILVRRMISIYDFILIKEKAYQFGLNRIYIARKL